MALATVASKAMTRKTSFYYSFLALPAPKRRAITAVFDFCRTVDDSVDLEPDPERALAAIASWRAEVDRVFTGDVPRTAEGRQLQPFVEPCHLPRVQFEALVDGVAMDAEGRTYEAFEDLEPYCHRVASAVGLICAEIFEYRDDAVREYARDLGVAPGDTLVSSPETIFDLAGSYPLEMKVVGVLAPSHGPDDDAI